MKTTVTKQRTLTRGADLVIKTSRKVGKNPTEFSEKRIRVDDLPAHPAYVRVDGGLTKNLGEYESAKLSVSISIPCHPEDKSIRKAYGRVSGLVEECLDAEYSKVMGE